MLKTGSEKMDMTGSNLTVFELGAVVITPTQRDRI